MAAYNRLLQVQSMTITFGGNTLIGLLSIIRFSAKMSLASVSNFSVESLNSYARFRKKYLNKASSNLWRDSSGFLQSKAIS
jgi:hypothetical protein